MRLSLIIHSELSDVSLVAVAIHRICLYLGMNELQASEVELCAVEAITNAIRHAYHGEPAHTVSTVLSTDGEFISLDISDTGTPMSVAQVKLLVDGFGISRPDSVDIDTLSEAGRGLHIIHELMDDVEYHSEDTGNRLVLRRRISH